MATTDDVKTRTGILTWERLEPVRIGGEYAFSAHDPADPNKAHYYWVVVMEDSLDLPEPQHRFAASWNDSDTCEDEHFGENLSRDAAMRLAEEHASKQRHPD